MELQVYIHIAIYCKLDHIKMCKITVALVKAES